MHFEPIHLFTNLFQIQFSFNIFQRSTKLEAFKLISSLSSGNRQISTLHFVRLNSMLRTEWFFWDVSKIADIKCKKKTENSLRCLLCSRQKDIFQNIFLWNSNLSRVPPPMLPTAVVCAHLRRQRRDNFAMLMAANLRKIAVQGAHASNPTAATAASSQQQEQKFRLGLCILDPHTHWDWGWQHVCVDWFIRKGSTNKNYRKKSFKTANGDRA